MLLSEMMIPMRNAYSHGDYPKACHLMHEVNSFLLGLDEGITDLPNPPEIMNKVCVDARQRQSQSRSYVVDCKAHYEQHSRNVMIKIGQYIQQVFKSLERMNYMGGVSAE